MATKPTTIAEFFTRPDSHCKGVLVMGAMLLAVSIFLAWSMSKWGMEAVNHCISHAGTFLIVSAIIALIIGPAVWSDGKSK